MPGTATNNRVTWAHPDPVAMGAVERSLSELWRQSPQPQTGQGTPGVTRACLWNLVVSLENPTEKRPGPAREGDALHEMLGEVAATLPARVIRLENWPRSRPKQSGREVEAWVSTSGSPAAQGRMQINAEVITLAGYGKKGPLHFPALVRALAAPRLPLALLCLDHTPRKGRMLGHLLRICDRILLDSQQAGDETSLKLINELAAKVPVIFYDLGWMRLTPVRHLLASFFDPPGYVEKLQRLERIHLITTPQGRTGGLLLLGWLLARCGLTRFNAVDLGGASAQRSRWSVKRGYQSFPAELETRNHKAGAEGLILVEVQSDGETFTLKSGGDGTMSVNCSHTSTPRVPLHTPSDSALVITGLSGHAKDPVYNQALTVAADLVEAEIWNR